MIPYKNKAFYPHHGHKNWIFYLIHIYFNYIYFINNRMNKYLIYFLLIAETLGEHSPPHAKESTTVKIL